MRGCERASNGLTHLYDVYVSAVIARAFAIVDRELATEKYALARVNWLFVDQYLSLSPARVRRRKSDASRGRRPRRAFRRELGLLLREQR